VKALEHSLRLGPTPEAVNQAAIAYRRAGDAKRADAYAGVYRQWSEQMARRKALLGEVSQRPREVQPCYALAELYAEAGQPDAAEQWLKLAASLGAGDPDARRLAAQVRRLRTTRHDAPLLPLP